MDRPDGIEGWDLIPSTTNMRKRRAARSVLGKILDQEQRNELPLLKWSIATTGTLNGEVDASEQAAKPYIFHLWVKALDLEDRSSGKRWLHARGHHGDVFINLWAELPDREQER